MYDKDKSKTKRIYRNGRGSVLTYRTDDTIILQYNFIHILTINELIDYQQSHRAISRNKQQVYKSIISSATLCREALLVRARLICVEEKEKRKNNISRVKSYNNNRTSKRGALDRQNFRWRKIIPLIFDVLGDSG